MGCTLDSKKICTDDEGMKTTKPSTEQQRQTYATLPKAFVTKPDKFVRPPQEEHKKETFTWRKLLLFLVARAPKQVQW